LFICRLATSIAAFCARSLRSPRLNLFRQLVTVQLRVVLADLEANAGAHIGIEQPAQDPQELRGGHDIELAVTLFGLRLAQEIGDIAREDLGLVLSGRLVGLVAAGLSGGAIVTTL